MKSIHLAEIYSLEQDKKGALDKALRGLHKTRQEIMEGSDALAQALLRKMYEFIEEGDI
jgi:hypothetical protein